MKLPSERTLESALRIFMGDRLDGVLLFSEALPFGGFEFRVVRGEGRGIKVARAKLSDQQVMAVAGHEQMAQLMYDVAHQLRVGMWMWDRPGGLVVGRIGKLRLFKRSAAIAVKAAA